MTRKWTTVLGWYGVGAILVAYILNAFQIITVENAFYLILNLTGGIGIIVHSWKQKDYPPVVLNVVWAFVALIAIIRAYL